LFFRELLKYTSPTNPEFADLDLARQKIEEVVGIINEGKRKSENQRKIMSIFDSVEGEWEEDLLQPTREYVTEIENMQGMDMRSNSKHTYTLFLFNDLIVVGKVQSGPGHHKPYQLKGFIPMKEAKFIDIYDTDTVHNMFEVRRGNAQATHTKASRVPVFQFIATSKEQKASIRTTIKGLIAKSIQVRAKSEKDLKAGAEKSEKSEKSIQSNSTSSLPSVTVPAATTTSQPTSTPTTPASPTAGLSVSIPPAGSGSPAAGTEGSGPMSPSTKTGPARVPPARPSVPCPPKPTKSPRSTMPGVTRSVSRPVISGQSVAPRRPAPPPPPNKPGSTPH